MAVHTYVQPHIHKYVCMYVSNSLYSAACMWRFVQYGLLDNRMVCHVRTYVRMYLYVYLKSQFCNMMHSYSGPRMYVHMYVCAYVYQPTLN